MTPNPRAFLLTTSLLWAVSALAQDEPQWIVLQDDAAASFAASLAVNANLTQEQIAGFSVSQSTRGRTVALLDRQLENLLQRVIHDELCRDHRIDFRRITPLIGDGVTQTSEIDQRGLAQNVMANNPRRVPGKVQLALDLNYLPQRIGQL